MTTQYLADAGGACDGVTCDVQVAKRWIAGNRGRLIIPAGVTVFSESLVVPSGVFIEGEGRGASIIKGATRNIDPIIFGGSEPAVDSGIRNISVQCARTAITLSGSTSGCVVENVGIDHALIGIDVKGDYSSDVFQDCIGHSISKIRLTNIDLTNLRLSACADITIDTVQTDTRKMAIGLLIDSGANSVRCHMLNLSGCEYGLIVRDNIGLGNNPTKKPSQPHQLFFSQVLADSSKKIGVWLQQANQVHFVDSWASGSEDGPGWNLGDGKGNIEQITLVACRAILNSQHGLNIIGNNAHAYVNVIGGHFLSNGNSQLNAFFGINVEENVSHVKIIGIDAYNTTRMGLSDSQRGGINVSPRCDYIMVQNTDTVANLNSGLTVNMPGAHCIFSNNLGDSNVANRIG